MAIQSIFDISYSCGHSESRDLSETPAGSRAGRADWLAKQKCFECFKKANGKKLSKEFEASRADEYSTAVSESEKFGLPVLEGSQKQIEWGVKVRHSLIRDSYRELVEDGGQSDDAFDATILEPARVVGLAKWWIDNRAAEIGDLPVLLADTGLSVGATSENPF